MAGRKLFVGSLPPNIEDYVLVTEFSKYGLVEDVFVKPNCVLGKQWAFVIMDSPEAAMLAKESCHQILRFHGTEHPCDVTFAKSGLDGGGCAEASTLMGGGSDNVPRKVFVGSLPLNISDIDLRQEFSKYGIVIDLHVNSKPVEAGRQWAFVTFANGEMAQIAKEATHRLLLFPGSATPCEVSLARHQGMYGKDVVNGGAIPLQQLEDQLAVPSSGPRKVFVGSLPQAITADVLKAEFSRFGDVVEIYINSKAVEPHKQWAFVTFATPEEASLAKDCTDRILVVPGASQPCEVMLAKHQGKIGQDPRGARSRRNSLVAVPFGVAPPPPAVLPPSTRTSWRSYKTMAGLPYYHNCLTGVTQWECPADLQVPELGAYCAAPRNDSQRHGGYSPY